MPQNVLIIITLSLIFLYNNYKKKLLTTEMLLVFAISVIIKIMLITLEQSGLFINQFTVNDETTFLSHDRVVNFSQGDNFLISLLYFFRDIYNSYIFIKYLPIFFSFIYFYYLIKILQNLKFQNFNKILILIFCLLSPAYLLFNYSITKEFLQGAFLAPSIYYSFKIIDKITIINFFKLIIFLILLSHSHRGFEIISIFIVLSAIGFSLFNNFENFFKKNLVFFLLIILILFFILFLLIINSSVGGYILSEEFKSYINNIRVSDHGAGTSYKVSIDNSNYSQLIKSISLTFFYYFFYVQGFLNAKQLYFLLDSFLSLLLIISAMYYIYKNRISHNNNYKFIFIIIIFLLISFGFAIYTFNTGNALRHKTVYNFILYLFMPLLLNSIYVSIKSFYSFFNQKNN